MSEARQPGLAWDEIKAWRKARRAQLVAARAARSQAERKAWNDRITEHFVAGFEIPPEAVVGFCWPYKGEFDARHAARRWRARGSLTALPEVTGSNAPLQFRAWWPGAPMRPGVYGIPVPEGTEIMVPDLAIVPMNAFDGLAYRLGYGGGFFDRTLAACERRMIAIGVSYEMLRLDTIYPQAHDVPMDFVVTEAGIHTVSGERLLTIDAAESQQRLSRLLIARRLPRGTHAATEYSSPVCYASQFPGYWGEGGEGA